MARQVTRALVLVAVLVVGGFELGAIASAQQAVAPLHDCDRLAANPTDARRHPSASGVQFKQVREYVKTAISACAAAVSAYPQELRFRYQLARALQIRDKNAAFQIFQQLVAANYPAAHDNAGWLFITERKDYEKAIALFKAGYALGDADCAVSLFTMIAEDRLSVSDADKMKIELLEKAAAAKHPGALVALPIERAKQGIVSNQPLRQNTDANLTTEKRGKSGSFPVASCKGWGATRTTLEGRDSPNAMMRGVVTDADVREYCERDPGGETVKHGGRLTVDECITESLKQVDWKRIEITSRADCTSGWITFQYGDLFTRRAQFPLASDTDTSCASGMPPVIDQFKQLCPAAAADLDVEGRRAPAAVNQLSSKQRPPQRTSQDRYSKLTVEALCSVNAVADPDWRDEVRRRNIAFEKCNPHDRGLSTMLADPKLNTPGQDKVQTSTERSEHQDRVATQSAPLSLLKQLNGTFIMLPMGEKSRFDDGQPPGQKSCKYDEANTSYSYLEFIDMDTRPRLLLRSGSDGPGSLKMETDDMNAAVRPIEGNRVEVKTFVSSSRTSVVWIFEAVDVNTFLFSSKLLSTDEDALRIFYGRRSPDYQEWLVRCSLK